MAREETWTSSSASATTSTPRSTTRARAARRCATTNRARREAVIREAVTLADYRDKYTLYRSDAGLRKLHARFPLVSLWDDHEVLRTTTRAALPDGGLPAADSATPSRAATPRYQAFFEAMPFVAVRGARASTAPCASAATSS